MKKRLIIIVSVVLVIAVGVTLWIVIPKQKLANGILAQVNGVSITQEQVDLVLEFNQIHMESLTRVLNQSLTDAQEIQGYINKMSKRFPTTKESVLTYLIQGEVVCQQLHAKGTLLSKEATVASFDKEFANQQTDESQKEFYEVLQQVLAEKKVTMERYVQLGQNQSYVFYNMQLAKQTFKTDGSYDESSALSLDGQFDNYLNDLVDGAKVKKAK